MTSTRILFVSDIHASNLCFRKFLAAGRSREAPHVQIIGGDITGKYLVPIVEVRRGRWQATFEDRNLEFDSEGEVRHFQRSLRDLGAYDWVCDVESARAFEDDSGFREEIDRKLRLTRLQEWVAMTEDWLGKSPVRVFISGGNDDPWYIDDVLKSSSKIECPDGAVVKISDQLTMLSLGVANITPWRCPRDLPEDEITARINALADRVAEFRSCVFNLHCPPFGTLLDQAPKLDKELRVIGTGFGVELAPAGSHAVRDAIERFQPVVSLHGHIHEGRGYQKLGATLCMNPGSEYSIGRLNSVYVEFDGSNMVHYELVKDLG